jgi:tetrapyrrole methylase family protein / MazG family protein
VLARIVGLGPGDPRLLTLGSLDALRETRALLLLAPRELAIYLRENGVDVDETFARDDAAIVRGSSEAIADLCARLPELGDRVGIGVLGNPLSDFPGLPPLLRALDARHIQTAIVPGMPRATLAESIAMPLIPLPPQSAHYSFDDLVEIMARLRIGCPWDREQTHRSLVPYLIEETFEVVEAIEHADDEHAAETLCDELGDLLLQIVFHSQLAAETGGFTIADVIDALSNKMVRRHPHVFADAVIEDVDAQWRSWERLKAQERAGRRRKSRLDGIPRHLGALQRGQRMQEKAARVGFDWRSAEGVVDKLVEEVGELAQARGAKRADDAHVREEMGDVFFTLVNLARTLGIDAEAAMRDANAKFQRRFAFMEERVAAQDKALSDLTLEELEGLWQQAKSTR